MCDRQLARVLASDDIANGEFTPSPERDREWLVKWYEAALEKRRKETDGVRPRNA